MLGRDEGQAGFIMKECSHPHIVPQVNPDSRRKLDEYCLVLSREWGNGSL